MPTARGDMLLPDMVVQGTDVPRFRLVVSIKMSKDGLDEATRQLGEYMTGEACPLGLLVTPKETHVYRRIWSDSLDAIEEFATVETPLLLNTRGIIENRLELERAVRQWLETLVRNPQVSLHREGEAARVEEELLPSLVDAVVTVVGFR
jgi:hypothetical protein